MAASTLIVVAVSIFSLYTTAIEQHRLRLVEIVKSQARMIEAIANFDNQFSQDDHPQGAIAATLQQVKEAHSKFEGFGDTGEFVLARRDDDQIVFILSRRHLQTDTPHPIPFEGNWAEPMRRALSGYSGIFTGLDYRGVSVLAAHEPVAGLDLGLVAKIDTSEIQAPFIRAGLLAVGIAILVIFFASRLFFRVSRPIEESIDQQAETFRTLAETAREGIILADTKGEIQYVNAAAQKLFGYSSRELIGTNVDRLMPAEHSIAHSGYMKNYLETGKARIIGTGRHLTALHKDGTRFPIYLSIGDINLSHTRLFAGVIMDVSEQQQLQREILEIPVSEQRRIGQELHDGLGQQLTGLGMLATSLLNKASKPEHEMATQLASGLQEAIAQVRALSRGLMPVEIDAAGFAHSLENLIADMRRQCQLEINLKINQEVALADNITAMNLFRIAQEALNNAIKHSGASKVTVSLGIEEGRGCLSIHDDGEGFDTRARHIDSLGLRIMQHRCDLIDAELRVTSQPGEGSEIKCYFANANKKPDS